MAAVTSEQKSRLEDRVLLAMRALMVLALAVMGATPFVQCSRLSVDRQSGASVAMAIIIDDSHSMRAITSEDKSRFELARSGAAELLRSARKGDAIALVLAGQPARLLLSPTPDLEAAERALESVTVSDRPTDLSGAVELARSSLKELPHVDKRVIALSDLAAAELPEGKPDVWTPLPALREQVNNCGIASAEHQGRSVLVTLGCTTAKAAAKRSVNLYLAAETSAEPLTETALRVVAGEQRVVLKHQSMGMDLVAKLSGDDAISNDDEAHVARELSELVVAVVADPTKASAITGGATLLEQALSALQPDLNVKPLGSLPVAAEDLSNYAALAVDDPPGLSPETRAAVKEWVSRGGVALGLLGPSATSAELAASIEPFARKGALWETMSRSVRIDVSSIAWLGPEASSLVDVGAQGRVRLDAADLPDTSVAGRWTDGVPLIFRREVSRGMIYTVGLPASARHSDFTLRPGFLALLDEVLDQARQRTGPRRSVAGTPWFFPAGVALSVTGPVGPLSAESAERGDTLQQRVTAELAGRYEIEVEGNKEARIVVLDPDELTRTPLDIEGTQATATARSRANVVDASPEWALVILALLALELLMRVFGEPLKRRFHTVFS